MAGNVVKLRFPVIPFFARKNGDGWDIVNSDTNVLVAWVRGSRKDALNELVAIADERARAIEAGKVN